MTRQSLWFCIRHVATNNLKLHECHYHSGTLQTANTCNLILINQCSLNHMKDKKIKTENKVRTITSALLVFIHHWYIIVWWKNWKNYPYYSLWLSTRTRILARKTRRGGESVTARGGSCNVHMFLHPPSSVCIPTCTYWDSPGGQTWGAKPKPANTFNHIQPFFHRVIFPLRHSKRAYPCWCR